MTTGVRDINWTRPNIRVGNICVCALARLQCLGAYVFVGYMLILNTTVERAIMYPFSNYLVRNSCRLYVYPLSNG